MRNKQRGIYWLRNDLRIFDNITLVESLKSNQEILFVFAETQSSQRAGSFRRKFIQNCFKSFQSEMNANGFTVLKTDLSFFDFVSAHFKDQPFDSLYFTKEYAWEERKDELQIERFCEENHIVCRPFDQGTLIRQEDLPFQTAEMPFVFTDFRKKVEAQLLIQPPTPAPIPYKENQGLARLKHYLWTSHAIRTYKQTRNGLIHFDDSSKLSPWLNLGHLSARSVYSELKKYEAQEGANDSTYWLFFELLWRDYMKFFSLKYGKKIFLPSGVSPGTSKNENNLEAYRLWCAGQTSDEFINANMNELNATGWMSNRGRQNVASYLIHDLGVNWTWGAAYFEEKLFDYDPDLNWGNWLYLSGRGSDPRARKFNTQTQAETYDPQGEYRHLWKSRLHSESG